MERLACSRHEGKDNPSERGRMREREKERERNGGVTHRYTQIYKTRVYYISVGTSAGAEAFIFPSENRGYSFAIVLRFLPRKNLNEKKKKKKKERKDRKLQTAPVIMKRPVVPRCRRRIFPHVSPATGVDFAYICIRAYSRTALHLFSCPYAEYGYRSHCSG